MVNIYVIKPSLMVWRGETYQVCWVLALGSWLTGCPPEGSGEASVSMLFGYSSYGLSFSISEVISCTLSWFSFSHLIASSLSIQVYRTLHLRVFLILGTGHKTARIASSNTVFNPFWVKAEHSKYFTAPTSLAIDSPWNRWKLSTTVL